MIIKILSAAVMAATLATPASARETVSAATLQVHERAIVLDTHLDTPSNPHRPGWSSLDEHSDEGKFSQDLPRMKAGGLDGVSGWSIPRMVRAMPRVILQRVTTD